MIDRHRLTKLLQRGPATVRTLSKDHGRCKAAEVLAVLQVWQDEGVVASERRPSPSGPAVTLWSIVAEPCAAPHVPPAPPAAAAPEPTPTIAPAEVMPPVETEPSQVTEEPPAHDNGKSDTLTIPKRRAVEMLAVGGTMAQVARELGRGESTIRYWLNNDEIFRRELRLTADRLRADFERRAISVGADAWSVVRNMVRSPNLSVAEAGARIAIAAGVRLSSRYREIAIDDARPAVPLVVFPPGTLPPWAAPPLSLPPGVHPSAADAVGMAFDEAIETDDDSESDEV